MLKWAAKNDLLVVSHHARIRLWQRCKIGHEVPSTVVADEIVGGFPVGLWTLEAFNIRAKSWPITFCCYARTDGKIIVATALTPDQTRVNEQVFYGSR
jgi:hypothetical protein